MSGNDLEEFRDRYRNWPTEDLVRVVAESEGYRPEAVSAAQEILATRDSTEVAAAADLVAAEQRQQEAAAKEPLSWGLKAVCLLFWFPWLLSRIKRKTGRGYQLETKRRTGSLCGNTQTSVLSETR